MIEEISIDKKNEVYMLVQAEPGIEQEISEYFTFFIPGYRFMPSFKNKMWDGKIRLYNLRSKELYIGLLDHLLRFTKERQYKIEYKMIAERRVRLGLLMQEIGSNNNITVTEDEVKNVIMQEAKRYPGEENKVLEFYKKTPEALNAVRGPIYEDKVVDYIIKNCSVSEKKVDFEELFTEVVKENENKKVNKNKVKKTKPLKTSE